MNAGPRRCSLVIRCYNERKYIGRLLASIAGQSVGEVDTVVVDSGSTDGTLEEVSRFPARLITVTPEEFSFGRSLNRGCEAAEEEIVAIASAHVYPTSDSWLEHLLAPFADPRVAMAYGRQRGHSVSRFSEREVFASWYPERSRRLQDVPFANNANSAIRRGVWQRMPFDESLTGLEDIAWAKAVMSHGYHVCYQAEAEVVHVHEETIPRIFHRYRREAIALKRLFPETTFSLWDFVRLGSANIVSDCTAAWRDGVLWAHLASVVAYRLTQFWGTYRGYSRPSALTEQLRRTLYYPKGAAWNSPGARHGHGDPVDLRRPGSRSEPPVGR